MVTEFEAKIYHQIWRRGIPQRFPVVVEMEGFTLLVGESQWEDILARVAEEQYQEYMKGEQQNVSE